MEIGRILGGRYKIGERIGSGGMSVVYRASEIGLDREVAIKVLLTALANEPDLVERFNREAKTIAGLQHPAIIPIYYYGIEEDFGSYLVMPMLKGGTLEQRLEQLTIRPSMTEVGELAKKLGSALQYAHDKGVVHRDIKFSNIMFDDAGSPYLMDFGIAKMLDATNLTGTGMTVGTPQFMPPEQWRNDMITPAVDQYAFAVLLYAMLTQRMPFDAPTPHALMYQHLQESPPLAREFRSDTPQEIEEALHKALSKEPENRFSSISEFTSLIADIALQTNQKYSGFFNAPLEQQIGQTNIGTTPHRAMPNVPTTIQPAVSTKPNTQQRSQATEKSKPNRKQGQVKPPTQIVPEPEDKGANRGAFIGGIVAVLLVGVIGIGSYFFFFMNNDNNLVLPTSASIENLTIVQQATETAIAFGAQSADDDETVTPTSTDSETTDEPFETASNTPTTTPNVTGTALAQSVTENAIQQATGNAAISLTGTALSNVVTEQAQGNQTSTANAVIVIETAQADVDAASTATVAAETAIAEAENQRATQSALNATATEDQRIFLTERANSNATSTALANNRNGTATAAAEIQSEILTAEANLTATARAIPTQTPTRRPTSTPTLTLTPVNNTTESITVGQALSNTADGLPFVDYTFTASAGDVISIIARSPDFDIALELYFGNILAASDDDAGYRNNARLNNLLINSAGTYTIRVSTSDGLSMNGDYTVGITPQVTCPDVQSSRLLVGDFARVTLDEGANRVRRNPNTGSTIVATMAEGEVFTVLQSVTCADGFAWYQVAYDDVIGWTAEGDDTDYWLELLPNDDPVLLAGGVGLTNGAELAPGEFQVEYFCSRLGLNTSNDTIDWFCINLDEVPIFTLDQSDFNQICRDTYDDENAFAQQDGGGSNPAFQWRCYYFPE